MEERCPVCGAPLENGKCGYCGYSSNTKVETSNESTNNAQTVVNLVQTNIGTNGGSKNSASSKSRMTALLLAIFLGGLGVHRFYAGKIGSGVLYLLTGGICGVGWLIDIILILMGSFKDASGVPIK